MKSFYNKPWSSGYALPAYLKKEDPLTRGSARVTEMLPRGTISHVAGLSKRTAGYSLPKYVRDEPVGSQARTTPWTPGGTVMSMKAGIVAFMFLPEKDGKILLKYRSNANL